MVKRRHDLWSGRPAVAAGLLLATLLGSCAPPEQAPLRVGVLLPLSGAGDVGWREPLEMALRSVNRAGGPAGRRVELVEQDVASVGLQSAAQALLDDTSVVAVIGPDTSSALMDVAPRFVAARKPIVSPSATSGEIFRAFGGRTYVWRTVQSDVAQAKALLLLARRAGATRVALVSSLDAYGNTFFDWVGFFATELGMEVARLARFAPRADCSLAVTEALAAAPDLLLVTTAQPEDAICVARRARALAPSTRLLFGDAGNFPAFVAGLGPLAEGIEGTAPSPDPVGGFEVAYEVLHGHAPPAYAANVHDALLLVAFGLERSGGQGGEALATSMKEVVSGRGARTGWDRQGVAGTLAALRRGERPDLVGASGPLDFDETLFTDPVATTYVHWRVDHGRYVPVESLSTGEAGRSLSIDRSFASERLLQDVAAGGGYAPGPRTGAWALIVALSSGWENYRHQADALAQYQLLRANGFRDDRIVLVMADDLAAHPANREPGVVRNVAGGPDLRGGAVVDHALAGLDAGDLLSILAGRRTARLPAVIESGPGDDVYAFFVGHGNASGMLVGATSGAGGGSFVTPEDLAATVDEMFQQGRYRRLLVVVETCHGGVMGTRLTAPGALLLAGANPVESSFAAAYDPAVGQWLADQFALQLVTVARSAPERRLDELYRDLFLRVSGSHVTLYNSRGFGGAGAATLGEFLVP